MSHFTPVFLRDHAQTIRDQFYRSLLDNQEIIPLQTVICGDFIQGLIEKLKIEYRDRVFNPITTLWIFISQVLSVDQSCRNAVSQFIAARAGESRNTPICSSSTGAYCMARKRLPEPFFEACAKEVGRRLEDEANTEKEWLWKEREVLLADGSYLTLEDTQENQRAYPFSLNPRKKLTFPMIRIVGIMSLSVGAILDLKIGPYVGKGCGETSLFMKMVHNLKKGTILGFDRCFANYAIIGACIIQGLEVISRFSASRKLDLRRAKRLAKGDYLVTIYRPEGNGRISDKEIKNLPTELQVRIVKVHVHVKGFRSKTLTLVTTLLDHKNFSTKDIANLYSLRWQCELDLRNIKAVMQMNRLRCRTPEMVRKEIWTHVLAYNIIRTIMAQACLVRMKKLIEEAISNKKAQYFENLSIIRPRRISFSAALQYFNSFRPYLTGAQLNLKEWHEYFLCILHSISLQTLLDRPCRIEPRALRKRNKRYSCFHQSRAEARKGYWKSGNAAMIRKRKLAVS